MSVESKRRHGPRSGKIFVRLVRERQIAEESEEQLRTFMSVGEPSVAFYPEISIEESDIEAHVVFDSLKNSEVVNHGRNGDLAKRSGVIINDLLEKPQSFPASKENLNFIKRHFKRILRFGRTARNKDKLHPKIQDILGL